MTAEQQMVKILAYLVKTIGPLEVPLDRLDNLEPLKVVFSADTGKNKMTLSILAEDTMIATLDSSGISMLH